MWRRVVLLLGTVSLVVLIALPAGAVSTTTAPSSGTNTGNSVDTWAALRVGNLFVFGGSFSSVRSTDGTTHGAGGLAAMDATTGAWVWSASPGGTTYALGTDGTSIWAGGTYGLRKYNQAGIRQSFPVPYPVSPVLTMAVGGGRIYYGGGGMAAITTSGAAIWRKSVYGIYSMALSGSQLLVGGTFCSVNGVSRPGLVLLNPDGSVDPAFYAPSFACPSSGVNHPSLAITVSGGVAFVGGGGSLNRVLAVDAATGQLLWQGMTGDGDVQAVTVQDGNLYIGGHFDCVSGTDGVPCLAVRHKAARYSLTGVLDPTWAPVFGGGYFGVRALAADDAGLYVGGNFTRIDGAVHNKLAIFR